MTDKIILKLIEKPAEGTATVFNVPNGPAFTSDGNVDYVCGMCKTVLAKRVNLGQIMNIVIRCHKCKRYNQC